MGGVGVGVGGGGVGGWGLARLDAGVRRPVCAAGGRIQRGIVWATQSGLFAASACIVPKPRHAPPLRRLAAAAGVDATSTAHDAARTHAPFFVFATLPCRLAALPLDCVLFAFLKSGFCAIAAGWAGWWGCWPQWGEGGCGTEGSAAQPPQLVCARVLLREMRKTVAIDAPGSGCRYC